jgi:hypothetical protein
MNDGARCYVEPRVPGVDLDADYLVSTKSTDELNASRCG